MLQFSTRNNHSKQQNWLFESIHCVRWGKDQCFTLPYSSYNSRRSSISTINQSYLFDSRCVSIYKLYLQFYLLTEHNFTLGSFARLNASFFFLRIFIVFHLILEVAVLSIIHNAYFARIFKNWFEQWMDRWSRGKPWIGKPWGYAVAKE